ncbi:MAG: extracellular solute-binding protein [Alphaproteobacteria bacterium]
MPVLLFLLAIFLAFPAHADHAIAMHGAPKYAADFHHFDYVDPDAPKGGTLRLGLTGSFDSVNPYALRGRKAYGVNGMPLYLYDSLLARGSDEPFTLYGLIAKGVASPPDRSSVTFTLDPAAKFHDGAPITSADVIFSWKTFRDHGLPNQRTYYKKIERAEAPDAYTVTFHFERNADSGFNREMPLIMGLMQVIPKHYWEGKDITAPTLAPPLGNGPYKIAAVDPGRGIVWERVKDYWAQDLPPRRGLNNFDEIRADYYRDEQVALQAFKAGQYDIRVEINPALWARGYDGAARDEGKYSLAEIPHHRVEATRAYAFNLRKPLFQDRVLRQAVNMAFDFEWINRVLFYGRYRRSESYFPNSELAATGTPGAEELKLLEPFRAQLPPELFTQEFSLPHGDIAARLRQAQHLLQEAGYSLQDGKLHDPQGTRVAFTIILNDPSEEKVALQLSRNVRSLGIEASVRMLDSAQYQAALNNFDYDMALVRWVNSLSPGNEQAFFWGSAAAAQPGSRNYAGIASPAIDRLITAITGADSRAGLVTAVHALDRILQWGYYAVPLYYRPADYLGIKIGLMRPAVTPLTGYVLESWWRAPGNN